MTPEPNAGEPFEPIARRDWAEVEDGTVRVAMVGVGWWTAEMAVPAVAESDLCETTVLVTGSPDDAGDLAAEYGIDHVLTRAEFHDGAAADAYDAVYVCTPNATHLEYVETAADLDRAVLCEKPMEATVDRAEALVAAAESVPLMVAYRMQTDPLVRRMRELVAEGAVGDPVLVHASMSQALLEVIPDPDQWRLDPDLVGGGATVMDIGVYPLNTARFVLDADPVAVQGAMASPDERFGSVPDERAAFTVEFPGPVYATCTASQNAHQRSHLRVTGTDGELLLEPAFFSERPRKLAVETDDGTATYELDGVDQMREEFDYFADRLLAGKPHHADAEHGLVDVRALAAVYDSAESGERIRLD